MNNLNVHLFIILETTCIVMLYIERKELRTLQGPIIYGYLSIFIKGNGLLFIAVLVHVLLNLLNNNLPKY